MRIKCEKCGQEYEVDESTTGKNVECSCGYNWTIPEKSVVKLTPIPKKKESMSIESKIVVGICSALLISLVGTVVYAFYTDWRINYNVKKAVENSRKSQETFDKGEEERKIDNAIVERLTQLEEISKQRKLRSFELTEGKFLVKRLETRYPDMKGQIAPFIED